MQTGPAQPPPPSPGAPRARHKHVQSALAFALSVTLPACTPPGPSPLAIARDAGAPLAPPTPLPDPPPPPDLAGLYAGPWTPAGTCAAAQPVLRTLLVEPPGPAGAPTVSGVNAPLRGLVRPDGTARLEYGPAHLDGHLTGDTFTGQADTGAGCLWSVALRRQPPIASAPGTGALPPATLPAAAIVQGEPPTAPANDVARDTPPRSP